MPKKSFDQRLKERWLGKQNGAHLVREQMMVDSKKWNKMLQQTNRIISLLFQREGRGK